MNNPYLAHFGAQIARSHFGAVGPGITDIVRELERWLTFVQEGGKDHHRSFHVEREAAGEENNPHNEFTFFPTTGHPSYDIGPDPLDHAQKRALKSLFQEAARVATVIEDYNTEQNKVASFKAGPGAAPPRLKASFRSFTVPGFEKEKFPCGYYVGLDYEAMVPRYKSSRYQQRFLMVLLGLLSDAVEAKHGYYRPPGGAWDAPTGTTPTYVRFMHYGQHLTKDVLAVGDGGSLDPGFNIHGIAGRTALAGLYSHMEDPRTGEEDNHDENAGGSVYRALISFVRVWIYPWLNCKMPIKLTTSDAVYGFPWGLNQHYFARDRGASFFIDDQVPEDKRGEPCSEIPDLPIPVVETTSLPTDVQRAALASPLPGPGVKAITWTNTMCRPFGAIAASDPSLVEMPPTERSEAPLTPPEEAAIEEVRTAQRDVETRIDPAPPAPTRAPTPYTPEPAPSAAPSAAPPPPPRGGILARRRRQEEEAAEQTRRTPAARIEEMSMKQLMVATALVGAGATLVGVMLTRMPRND